MIHSLLVTLLFLFAQDEGQYERLLQQVRDAVRGFMEPEDGLSNSQFQYWNQVLQDVETVHRLKPNRETEIAYQLASGMKHYTRGNVSAALEDFEFGLTVDPNQTAIFHFGIGLCYSASGKNAESEQAFRAAAERAAHWARPRFALAALYTAAGRFREAEAAVNESIDRTGSDRAKGRQYLLLAQLHQFRGRSHDAEIALRRAVEVNASDALLHDYFGLLVFKTGGKNAALQVWKSGLDKVDQNSALMREIALVENGIKPEAAWKDTFTQSTASRIEPAEWRAFRFQVKAGETLRFRTESSVFAPFSALLSVEGKIVALHDIRSTYYSYLDYTAPAAGAYYLVVTSYLENRSGDFKIVRLTQ